MSIPEILFWFFVAVLLYSYVGYGALIAMFIRAGLGRKTSTAGGSAETVLPHVFFVITAYNEEAIIAAKIANSLALDYPSGKLTICVNADGSTDATAAIAAGHPGVVVLHQVERMGKAAAMNRSVEHAGDAELLVFSDANSILASDALRLLVRHYADPGVGAVSGEKKVLPGGSGMVQAVGESLYWKYESFMKALDARFHTVVGAAGELLSVRRVLYKPMPSDTILDDLHLSFGVCLQGSVVAYEPAAVAMESASGSLAEEWERKVRIGAGAFQALSRFPGLLLPWPDVRLWFQFLSRRFLRWVACPVIVPSLLALNVVLASADGQRGQIYSALLTLHLLFYGLALAGGLAPASRYKVLRLAQVPFYFLFMHYSLWAGFFRWMTGGQSAAWDKARRQGPSN